MKRIFPVSIVVGTGLCIASCSEVPSKHRPSEVGISLIDAEMKTPSDAALDVTPDVTSDDIGSSPVAPPIPTDWALSCIQPYNEVLTPAADVSDLAAGFSPTLTAIVATSHALLDRRYQHGHWIVTHPLAGNDLDFWIKSQSTFEKLVRKLSTAVHEVCHQLTHELMKQNGGRSYPVRSDLVITAVEWR